MNKPKAIRLIFLGDHVVGKSSIIHSILNDKFKEDQYCSIISDVKYDTKFSLKNGNQIKLILYDTAYQERFLSSALNTAKYCHGAVIVFDLTKKESFNNLKFYLEAIQQNTENIFIIIFGNKIDIGKDRWEVAPEEAKNFAKDLNLPYFEVSPKTKQGINEGISYLVNEIYEKSEKFMDSKIKIGENNNGANKTNCVGKNKKNKK